MANSEKKKTREIDIKRDLETIKKLSPKKKRKLEAYLIYCKTINIEAEASQDFRDWPEFQLKPETIQQRVKKMESIGTLKLVSNDKERRLVFLDDLIKQKTVLAN